MLSELIKTLSLLLCQSYPQVLTHGDLSMTNSLVDENNFEITSYRLASSDDGTFWHGFGYSLLGHRLHDPRWLVWFICQPRLLNAFWGEFWAGSGIEGDEHQSGTRSG